MAKKTYFFLILILLLAVFLRFYRLTEVPPSLFGDELDVGYQAWSILKTGRDYSGNPWPIHFQSLADWRTPLFLYATVPFVWIFGLTELGVRLAPALFGILTIPVMYLLVRELFLSLHLGGAHSHTSEVSLPLIATLVLAISPWHLQYSRAAFEVTQMLFLMILGVWAFFKGLKNGWWLTLSALCLALTPYSYNTAKLFTPLFIILLVFSFRKKVRKVANKKLLLAFLVLILTALPITYDIFFGEGGSRFAILSIFTDPTTIPKIGFKRLEDAKIKLGEVPVGFQPTFASRFFHNKFLSWGKTFLTNYFRAFSSEFLFTFGDINFRHSIQGGFGQLFWLDALFLPLGAYWLLIKVKDKNLKLFLLGWLFLAPLPSALTRDGGNHATRLILMLPPLLILVSLGIFGFLGYLGYLGYLGNKRKKILASFLLSTFYFLIFILYLHRYYVHWPRASQQWWHSGFKEAITYIKENEKNYEKVILSTYDEPPLIFFLAWYQFDPATFQKNLPLPDVVVNQSIEAKKLGKFYLGQNARLDLVLDRETLYLAPFSEIKQNLIKEPGRTPPGIMLKKAIAYPNGEPAFYLFTGTKESL